MKFIARMLPHPLVVVTLAIPLVHFGLVGVNWVDVHLFHRHEILRNDGNVETVRWTPSSKEVQEIASRLLDEWEKPQGTKPQVKGG